MSFPILKRALAVWLLIIVAESIHGTLRTIFLEPVLGGFRARQLSIVTATIIIFTITWCTMRWMRAAASIPSLGREGAATPSPSSTTTQNAVISSERSDEESAFANACWRIGAIWVVLSLVFEFSLGLSLGMTWPRMVEDYDLARGRLMLFGLAAMFAMPWLVNRLRT